MKLAHAVFASTAIVLGIAACASPGDDEQEELGTTSQALCAKGVNCTATRGGNVWGGIGSSGLVLDPGTGSSSGYTGSSGTSGGGGGTACNVAAGGSFTCAGPVPSCNTIARETGEACDLKLRCTTQGCDCIPGCGGGSFSFGGWNPCRAGLTYTCIGTYCRCN